MVPRDAALSRDTTSTVQYYADDTPANSPRVPKLL